MNFICGDLLNSRAKLHHYRPIWFGLIRLPCQHPSNSQGVSPYPSTTSTIATTRRKRLPFVRPQDSGVCFEIRWCSCRTASPRGSSRLIAEKDRLPQRAFRPKNSRHRRSASGAAAGNCSPGNRLETLDNLVPQLEPHHLELFTQQLEGHAGTHS